MGARVLFASSGGALYGRDAPVPSAEDVPPLPESPYGIAKYCAEQYIGLYNRLHGTRHSVLRLANVYGPLQDPGGDAGVIPIFCSAALAGRDPAVYGDGSQTRDYVYVGDVVRAFLAAADSGQPGNWNIGTGVESACSTWSRSSPAPPAARCTRNCARPGPVSCSAASSQSAWPSAS